MNEKQKIKEKISVIRTSLQKKNSWYTGLSIKRYLRKNIFSLQTPEFSNTSINSGRWSCYCHYSQVKAFQNLLDKHQIGFQSPVIVHPLLPEYLVDELIKREVEMVYLDIDKNSLNFNKEQIQPQIEAYEQVKPIELVIHYGFNGLYEEIIEMVKIAEQKIVPTMFVCDNFDLNLALLDLFDKLNFGSVLWAFGDSFFDDQLNQVLDVSLESQPWFISWFTENRTKSILEYHLSESQGFFDPLIEAFAYLLTLKIADYGLFEKAQSFLTEKIYFAKKFSSKDDAIKIIKTKYEQIFTSAIPDLVFDLQTRSPETFADKDKPSEIIHKSAELQNKAKDLYEHFLEKLKEVEPGSLEVPNYYLDRSYLKYFVFTTSPEDWKIQMQNYGFFSETLVPIHPKFKENQRLPVANFVSDYGFFVDVWSGIES